MFPTFLLLWWIADRESPQLSEGVNDENKRSLFLWHSGKEIFDSIFHISRSYKKPAEMCSNQKH